MSINVSRSDFTRIVVAVDPAVTATEDSDDTGIIVVARGPHQPSTCKIPFCPGHGYVLDDKTCHELPADAMKVAITAYDLWQADRVVGETNNGGDYIGTVLHAIRAGVPYSTVTASRGKQLRAEPVSALYEQGRVHHVGNFPELEQEQATWTPDSKWSPDRLDALVWGLTFLGLVGGVGDAFITAWKDEIANRKPAPPPELKSLPHHVNLIDRPVANERCKGGSTHRFQREANGNLCMVCGCWQEEIA